MYNYSAIGCGPLSGFRGHHPLLKSAVSSWCRLLCFAPYATKNWKRLQRNATGRSSTTASLPPVNSHGKLPARRLVGTFASVPARLSPVLHSIGKGGTFHRCSLLPRDSYFNRNGKGNPQPSLPLLFLIATSQSTKQDLNEIPIIFAHIYKYICHILHIMSQYLFGSKTIWHQTRGPWRVLLFT